MKPQRLMIPRPGRPSRGAVALLPLLLAIAIAAPPSAAAETWKAAGPFVGGWYLDVALDPRTGDTIYLPATTPVSYVNGKTHVSSDAGATWTTYRWRSAKKLRPHPNHPERLFALSSRELHLSTNAGRTWSKTAVACENLVSIAFSPLDPEAVYVGGTGVVWRSTDAGDSWIKHRAGLPREPVRDLAPDPFDRHRIYAAARDVYVSLDGGESWLKTADHRDTGEVVRLLADPARAGTLWAGGSGAAGVSRSTDAGSTWQRVLPGGHVADLDATPDGRILVAHARVVAATGEWRGGLQASSDGGTTWERLDAGIQADGNAFYELAVAPSGRRLALATYIGLYLSEDAGATWRMAAVTSSSDHEAWDIAAHPQDPDRLAVSSWNALFLSRDRGDTWKPVPYPAGRQGGNWGWRVSYDPHHPDTLWLGGGYHTRLHETADEGATWTTRALAAGPKVVHTFRLDPADANRIWAGTDRGIYLSTDRGATWTNRNQDMVFSVLRNGTRRAEILSIAVDPADPRRVYAGGHSRVFVSTDGGGSWDTRRDLALDFPNVRTLEIDPCHARTVFAGTNASCVFRSTDGGATWPLRQLRYISIWDVVFTPCGCPGIYAASGHGLFRSADGGESWEGAELGGNARWAISAARTVETAGGTYSILAGIRDAGLYRLDDRPAKCAGTDLAVSQADAPDPIPVYSRLTYTVNVANQGPGDASGVKLIETLDRKVSLLSVTTTQGSCRNASGAVTCDLGALGATATPVTVTLAVRPYARGTVVATARVHGREPDPRADNNQAAVETTVLGRATPTPVATRTPTPGKTATPRPSATSTPTPTVPIPTPTPTPTPPLSPTPGQCPQGVTAGEPPAAAPAESLRYQYDGELHTLRVGTVSTSALDGTLGPEWPTAARIGSLWIAGRPSLEVGQVYAMNDAQYLYVGVRTGQVLGVPLSTAGDGHWIRVDRNRDEVVDWEDHQGNSGEAQFWRTTTGLEWRIPRDLASTAGAPFGFLLHVQVLGYPCAPNGETTTFPRRDPGPFLFTLLGPGGSGQATGRVYGLVLDREAEAPLQGAEVWAASTRAGRTAEAFDAATGAGWFHLALPAGDWELHAEFPGYEPHATRLTLAEAASSTVRIDFGLDRSQGR